MMCESSYTKYVDWRLTDGTKIKIFSKLTFPSVCFKSDIRDEKTSLKYINIYFTEFSITKPQI